VGCYRNLVLTRLLNRAIAKVELLAYRGEWPAKPPAAFRR
jgi:hypothetical protein